MGRKLLVCGGNGAGKSTLGRYLAERLACPFADIEDYYFPKRSLDYPYGEVRSREAVRSLLLADLRRHEDIVIAAVKPDFGRELETLLTCAVLVQVPREVRLKRVRDRSSRRFGSRMLPGGDLWEQETRFFEMVAARDEGEVENWLEAAELPVIRVDGTQPIERAAAAVLQSLGYRSSQR